MKFIMLNDELPNLFDRGVYQQRWWWEFIRDDGKVIARSVKFKSEIDAMASVDEIKDVIGRGVNL